MTDRVETENQPDVSEPALACVLLEGQSRVTHPVALFGPRFGWKLEPVIYAFADRLSPDYSGGHWDMLAVSNGAFYMRPSDADGEAVESAGFHVVSDNGFECRLSADALGITVCLYAYSHLSFDAAWVGDELAEVCARQYHLLREWALSHTQAGLILAVID